MDAIDDRSYASGWRRRGRRGFRRGWCGNGRHQRNRYCVPELPGIACPRNCGHESGNVPPKPKGESVIKRSAYRPTFRAMLAMLLLLMCSPTTAQYPAPLSPYDKVCQVQSELFREAMNRARVQNDPAEMDIVPDLINSLPKEEQTTARNACREFDRRILSKPGAYSCLPSEPWQACKLREENSAREFADEWYKSKKLD